MTDNDTCVDAFDPHLPHPDRDPMCWLCQEDREHSRTGHCHDELWCAGCMGVAEAAIAIVSRQLLEGTRRGRYSYGPLEDLRAHLQALEDENSRLRRAGRPLPCMAEPEGKRNG